MSLVLSHACRWSASARGVGFAKKHRAANQVPILLLKVAAREAIALEDKPMVRKPLSSFRLLFCWAGSRIRGSDPRSESCFQNREGGAP